jgi:glycosyltransferase involved in cell wall biosynthesis
MHVDPAISPAERDQLRRGVSEAAKRLRGIIVPCEITRRDLVDLGADPARLPVIPLGVDTSHFRPPTAEQRSRARTELGIAGDVFLIGSFLKDGQGWGDGSEPKPIKGPDIFLAVLERVAHDHPNLCVLLTGPARGFVKAGLERLGIPFVHRNLKDYRRMVDLYHALDLCLITSRCEGGPLSFAESWATAVPTVSTRVGIAEDLTVQGENGFVAEIDDAEALAAFVSALIVDPALRRHCTEGALHDVGQIAWSEIARRHYDELYAPLLS